jgi:dolichol kinase
MKKSNHQIREQREHHPQVGVGLFFIVLGLALLVATNDMLHLGSIKEYFTWQSAMVFIGALLLLNLQFVPGLLLIAGGAWFMMDDYMDEIPRLIKTLYWPGVIMLLGISFIISSFFRSKKKTQ